MHWDICFSSLSFHFTFTLPLCRNLFEWTWMHSTFLVEILSSVSLRPPPPVFLNNSSTFSSCNFSFIFTIKSLPDLEFIMIWGLKVRIHFFPRQQVLHFLNELSFPTNLKWPLMYPKFLCSQDSFWTFCSTEVVTAYTHFIDGKVTGVSLWPLPGGLTFVPELWWLLVQEPPQALCMVTKTASKRTLSKPYI